MKIFVEYLDNKKIKAKFDGFEVVADQPERVGGDNQAPSPFDYFPVATALCAGHYVRAFCEKRGLSHNDIEICQEIEKIPEENNFKRKITINIKPPKDFPKKYHRALLVAAGGCAVKKVVDAGPLFEIKLEN